MKKINVLYIIWSMEGGGAEQVVYDIAKKLNRIFKPIVCCLNWPGKLSGGLKQANIKVIPLYKKPNFDPLVILKIIKVIKKENIDIVHTHLWTSNFWGRIAAKLAGVKVIIATEHTTDENRPWYYYTADRILAKISDKIIAVSKSVKKFHQTNTKINDEKFSIIHNGINVKKFEVNIDKPKKREEFGINPNETVIGLIGRFVPAKAHDIFVESFKKVIRIFPHVKALFVGDGPLENKVKKFSKEQGVLDKIIFAGFRKDIPEILQIVDIFVLSSNREGLPLTLLEAMTVGIPSVITNVGGNSELCIDGKTGFLVEPNNPNELANAILKILKNPEQKINFNIASRERIKKFFTNKHMVQKTENLYLNLLQIGRRNSGKNKILLIVDHLDSGGAQRQVVEIAKSLNRKKYDITVCNLDKEKNQFKPELDKLNIKVFSLQQYGKFDISTLFSLYKFIKKSKFDIVHTYLFTADCYGRIAAKLAHTPVILTSIRSIDNWKNSFHIWTDRLLALFTDKIIINAKILKKFLVDNEKLKADKITTIYNGIDEKLSRGTNLQMTRKRFNIKKDDLVIGIIARNDKLKDHSTFFQAAKIIHESIPKTKFLAVGYGMENSDMKNLVKKNGIQDCVILRNYTPNIIDIIDILDVSVLSSIIEGCSNTILESMVMGKPVVATAAGGNPELVIDGKTGYIVPSRNSEKLAESVLKILSNETLRKKMGRNGYDRIVKKFTISKMVFKISNLYQKLLLQKKYSH